MYQVLVPVDESEARTLAQAEMVADLPDAAASVTATLLYVDDGETSPTAIPAGERAAEHLRDRDVSVDERASSGDPAPAIVAAAEDIDADLIVLGGRKRSQLGSLLFGSVSQSVALQADRPVTITGSTRDAGETDAGTAAEADDAAGPAVSDVTFQKRNVSASADHELAFYGSFRYEADGSTHAVERTFNVYTAPDSRTEEGYPVADVHETHAVEDRGETDHLDPTDRQIVVQVDPDLPERLEATRIEAFLDSWHRDHPRPS